MNFFLLSLISAAVLVKDLSPQELTALKTYEIFYGRKCFQDICVPDGPPAAINASCDNGMPKCLISVGATGAATCALSGFQSLGFTCIGALVGGGLGTAGCFYQHCHFT